ncbi:tautomerase family protein [Sphingomonas sp. CGMCC 1.13654]|uniref:Tautomerase family protein n=1 Tax=Sphingomonas chungangi TaxID=2683589 RepID=A0A838L526_9SPHN|nr:tautomerase family protein [Sphingomonas chungangi]MBA2933559.1 tautomerase family protein [Sphingomonas chungangi]MVW54892.1 4-oxalocrotonate tautomerase [Sphingomonas chungangi]
MPLAQISILEGRSEAMISRMAEDVTQAISVALATPRDKIRIVVTEIPTERWFIAGESVGARARAADKG